jgi:hypothetical protein
VSFTAEWLKLREPYDRRARNASVLDAVASAVGSLPFLTIVDLACGTGSTMRAISSHLPARQTWRLVDNNLGLLGRAADAAPAGVSAQPKPVDLARDLELALDGPTDLITTSALLDLVSAEWLDRFLTEASARRLPLYAALTYDGRVELEPGDPLDKKIVAAVNRHQRREKGFGPALGPEAAPAAIRRSEALGYAITHGYSDWVFEPSDRKIQEEVLAGWAAAARETGDVPLPDILSWITHRREFAADGRSRMRVGHVDFLARPTGTR